MAPILNLAYFARREAMNIRQFVSKPFGKEYPSTPIRHDS
jgi:hypothetical protein